jgi:hypothetical protein
MDNAESQAQSLGEPGPGLGLAPQKRLIPGVVPPGNTGTHLSGVNEYLLAAATRANIFTTRRHPLVANADNLGVELQRFVHHEGTRPPNRQILLHLRLLTLPDILPELVTLLSFENVHVCRLAHYHIRQAAPITDSVVYRDLVEVLEREVARPSPARRAAATKTLAKIFVPRDVNRALEFVTDVFKCIGGARVKDPNAVVQRRKVAGIAIPGTDVSDKSPAASSSASSAPKKTLSLGGRSLTRGQAIAGDGEEEEVRTVADDGAGGTMVNVRGNAEFVKSRFGKMLVGHSVYAALRRINRMAAESIRVEAYFFDSGLMSVVPSTVRHCVALLEIRADRSPAQVSRYLLPRLPHKNPPDHKKLQFEDLGAKVYFARLLGALAEDPNLASYSSSDEPESSSQSSGNRQANRLARTGIGSSSAAAARAQALAGDTAKEKASNFFKFLFNKDRIAEMSSTVKASSSAIASSAALIVRPPKKHEDPRGVEFAEALVNLLKNPSNRVLLESLRSLSHRRWTTWFEAPISQSALYNSPELVDPSVTEESGRWGIDSDDDDEDADATDADELGAYEDDIANEATASVDGAGASLNDAKKVGANDADDEDNLPGKPTWMERVSAKRKERRDAQVSSRTPFYLRELGHGMVPALEVILRRLYASMLHEEAIRRFAAADAVVALARAKLYGHTQNDQDQLRKAKSTTVKRMRSGVTNSSQALVALDGSGSAGPLDGSNHPFEPLVVPLKDIMDEDPNFYVRGRAAIALMFVIAAGAGRKIVGEDSSDSPLLVRVFKSFATTDVAGHGIGLRLMCEVMDYLLYELLDVAPELSASAIELAELWAMRHPTVGVCGRLGALWEKVLSLGNGGVVGASIFRAMAVKPHVERVASAAAAFLRRRTLDLAIITVGSSELAGYAVPEPLPRSICVEMEKYFSLLWHSALLGPSAECRTLSIEAMGGAAALAGDPLRVTTYERLVELVRVRGLGLKIPAENVMDCLDILYSCRERFSEARHKNGIARNGRNTTSAWLQIVWRLAAEASSAAQILLGVPPPTGWQPLGPSGANDVSNAEFKYGDVRDRQQAGKLKDASIANKAAPSTAPLLAIEPAASSSSLNFGTRRIGSSSGDVVPAPSGGAFDFGAYAPKNFNAASSRRDYHSDDDDDDDIDIARYQRRSRSPRSKSPSRPPRRRNSWSPTRPRSQSPPRRRSRSPPSDGRDTRRQSLASGPGDRLDMSGLRESLGSAGQRVKASMSRREQEIRDAELALKLQREEDGQGRKLFGDDKLLSAASRLAPAGAAGKMLINKAAKAAKSMGSGGGRGGGS